MKKIVLLTLLLVGCDQAPKYTINSPAFETERGAAISFTKRNMSTIEELGSDGEILGWTLNCDGKHFYTTAHIGGITNPIAESQIRIPRGCAVTAMIHSHPKIPGMTSNFFSKADLSAAKEWHMYLFVTENCIFRYADKDTTSRYGTALGRIQCKNLYQEEKQ